MNMFLKVLDGTGKPPRDIQIDYFNHLIAQPTKTKVHCLDGPPGIGKSFIARTIQRALPGTTIVTTNNVLVDQYCETYPELNGVKGKDYYETEEDYRKAIAQASIQSSVFNPLSFYYYYLRFPHLPRPRTVIIDEAHKLGDMLMLTITKAYNCEYFGIPKDLDDVQFLAWLESQVGKLTKLYDPTLENTKKNARKLSLSSQYEQLKLMYDYLKENLAAVKVGYEMREVGRNKVKKLHLTIQPLIMPAGLIQTIFGNAKIFLFSGSLTKFHLKELFPTIDESHIDYKQYEPVAPIAQWPIFFTPLPQASRADPKAIAKSIQTIYEKEGKPNTVVHVSYGAADEIAKELRALGVTGVINHDKFTKLSSLETFKKRGGILLASGMAEGIDLPGDLCRLIIIPRLLFPNLGDQAVKKRLALADTGQEWYNITTMMVTVQQIGRGVRGATDACRTYILDTHFPRLVKSTSKYLTNGFKAAIKWSSN